MQLSVKNIKKTFGEKEVLHGISFEVSRGKALGLLGRNGAGKTTTIRILMDLFEANEGTITIDGKPFDPRNYQIGYLPEERGLYPKKKVVDQLMYLGELRGLGKADLKKSIDYWLDRLEVMEYKDKKLETLSKGNQQKVQLASTFLCHPEIIILDEPFSGLDPVNSQILKEVIREQIAAEKLVIFSSHQMTYIEEFCEEITLIDKGDVVLQGNLNKIKKEAGKDRLVIKIANKSPQETLALLQDQFSRYLTHQEIRRDKAIIKLASSDDKHTLMKAFGQQEIDVELFSMYHPSLEDIFIQKVGE